MIPGEVFWFSSNSFVLCVDQRKEKGLVPKTSRLNPNADVFRSVNQPQIMPPHDHMCTASSWTEQAASTICSDSPSGSGSRIQFDGGSPTPGAVQMAIVYSPSSENLLSCGATSPALIASGADVRSSIGETGPLEDFVETGQLRMMLKRQLEYYFSRENLAIDTYLVSQMDADQFVPITTVANFDQVKSLTRNFDLVVETLRDSANVQVDECGEKVRPLNKRCIVILREIPESTSVEEVERLFASESCPVLVSCQFAHNSSWYVTFANEEDAQKAYRYLREEVKTFRGMPIMARIKAKPLLSYSYAMKDMNANCASTIFQQPKFMYTSPVPTNNIQYNTQQVPNMPLFTQHCNMSSIWPTSLIYYDPGMVFAANGYVPTATYTPSVPPSSLSMPASLQPCEDHLNSRNRDLRSKFGNHQNILYHGDANENEFRHSWPQQSIRVTGKEYHESHRLPRYGGGGPSKTPGHAGPHVSSRSHSLRTGLNCQNTQSRNPLNVQESNRNSENNFSRGCVVRQSECLVDEIHKNTLAVSVGELILPPRSNGSYKSRRKIHHVSSESTKANLGKIMPISYRIGLLPNDSGLRNNGIQPNGEVFKLEENLFPPLLGSEKLSTTTTSEKLESRFSELDQSVVQVLNRTQKNAEQSADGTERPKVMRSLTIGSSRSAATVTFSDTRSYPTSTAIEASSDRESHNKDSPADGCSQNTRQNKAQSENCVEWEVAGLATVAYEFVQKSTSICSLCPISDMHLSSDEYWKSSLKPSYAQMALRGKEQQESKVSNPVFVDSESLSTVTPYTAPSCSADACTELTVSRAAANDDVMFNSKENRLGRAATENRCCFLRGY